MNGCVPLMVGLAAILLSLVNGKTILTAQNIACTALHVTTSIANEIYVACEFGMDIHASMYSRTHALNIQSPRLHHHPIYQDKLVDVLLVRWLSQSKRYIRSVNELCEVKKYNVIPSCNWVHMCSQNTNCSC